MSQAAKGDLLYEGKAKKMYAVHGRPDAIWVEYKDSLTAFNAQKTGSFRGKGEINAQITEFVYEHLRAAGIKTHVLEIISPREMICTKVTIIPLEVVVRNRLAGSTAKKLGRPEGTIIPAPLVEFYFKDDALNDPFVSDDQALLIGAVKVRAELDELRLEALRVNHVMRPIFARAGLELIDFKLEYGRDGDKELVLADEISPDTCRLWDAKTGEKYDKDRFRRDLGGVEDAYRAVLARLKGSVR